MGVMFWISPLLAAVSLTVIPLAVAVTFVVAKRSQVRVHGPVESNGNTERVCRGDTYGPRPRSGVRPPPSHDRRVLPTEPAAVRGELQAQFLAGIIQPTMQFLANLNYVAIAVLGGYRVASGAISLGDVQAFIQYSPSSRPRSPRSPAR